MTTDTPYYVEFFDTGEKRLVTHECRRCLERSWLKWTIREAPIVGPRGVAHVTHDVASEKTLCGKDATGKGWWWRL